ncbi:hypothetical protein BD311DRAFT_761203 [Dichomitus squalens]|uniref:Uncharacterized protein n=1 Tax=Dichomitus squalens TaxID=114155 RepID=A0A4Q9MLP1_9APHY|nr:hypothetical protein BD311DRAFT_761203 [Dichomitus squalens]
MQTSARASTSSNSPALLHTKSALSKRGVGRGARLTVYVRDIQTCAILCSNTQLTKFVDFEQCSWQCHAQHDSRGHRSLARRIEPHRRKHSTWTGPTSAAMSGFDRSQIARNGSSASVHRHRSSLARASCARSRAECLQHYYQTHVVQPVLQ